MYKNNFRNLSFFIAALLVLLASCTTKNKTSGTATISLTNYQPIDSAMVKGEKIALEDKTGFKIYDVDSLEAIEKYFEAKTPLTKNIEIAVKENGFTGVLFRHGLEDYMFYVGANDKLELTFDATKKISKITFNGDEHHPALLFATNSFYLHPRSFDMSDTSGKSKSEVEQFMKAYKESFIQKSNDKKQIIKKALSENKITQELSDAMQKHIDNDMMIHHVLTDTSYKMQDKFLSLINSRAMPDVLLEQNGILDNGNITDITAVTNKTVEAIDKVNASNLFEPKSKNIAMMRVLDILGILGPQNIKPNLHKVADVKARAEFDKILTNRYMLDFEKYKYDSLNANIISNDKNKTVTTLKDLIAQNKGKVVYVDLWASWCGYCRIELPYSHKLQKELESLPVTFLYLSTDENFEDWIEANDSEGMTNWDNSKLLVNANHAKEILALKIDGIPRYLLYDKTGKLVNTDAPRPSDPKTKTTLLSLIKK